MALLRRRCARLEGWPRGPWFATALKKRLLTMRFLCSDYHPFHSTGSAKGPASGRSDDRLRPVLNSQ
jgi:hypothetical protein